MGGWVGGWVDGWVSGLAVSGMQVVSVSIGFLIIYNIRAGRLLGVLKLFAHVLNRKSLEMRNVSDDMLRCEYLNMSQVKS